MWSTFARVREPLLIHDHLLIVLMFISIILFDSFLFISQLPLVTWLINQICQNSSPHLVISQVYWLYRRIIDIVRMNERLTTNPFRVLLLNNWCHDLLVIVSHYTLIKSMKITKVFKSLGQSPSLSARSPRHKIVFQYIILMFELAKGPMWSISCFLFFHKKRFRDHIIESMTWWSFQTHTLTPSYQVVPSSHVAPNLQWTNKVNMNLNYFKMSSFS